MTYQLHEHANAAAAAQAQAEAVAEALQQALAAKGRAVLAVSGGKSPIAFFEALSQIDLDWANVGITLVDERIVPTTHADSNTGLVRQFLLKNQAAAASWIPMIAEGADEAALADATTLLGLGREGTHEAAPGVYRFGFKRAWHSRRALDRVLATLYPV